MRIELIHPALVHFPIALLLTGAGLRVAAFLLRKSSFYSTFLFTSRLILALGVCFAILAIIAGELAEDIVAKTLCHPHAIKEHSTLAYAAAFLFGAGLLLDCAQYWLKRIWLRKAVAVVSAFLLGVGAVILLGAAFKGGELVFKQGAAVENSCQQ